MKDPEFKPCPFCGDTWGPSYTYVRDEDDRRYMQLELECDCGCTFISTIGYGSYRHMSKEQIEEFLKNDLAKAWNRRDEPDGEYDYE